MGAYLAGSMLFTWVLCSALNELLEALAQRAWFSRATAFVGMMIGLLLCFLITLGLTRWAVPATSLGAEHLTGAQLGSVLWLAPLLNGLLVLAFGLYQLKRFWQAR